MSEHWRPEPIQPRRRSHGWTQLWCFAWWPTDTDQGLVWLSHYWSYHRLGHNYAISNPDSW